MKFYCPKRNRHLAALLLAGMFLVPSFAWGINTISTGFKTTSTPVMVDAHNNCKQLSQPGGGEAFFVPTKTSTEWSTFLSNKPAAIDANGCPAQISCQVRYRIKDANNTSPWQQTPLITGAFGSWSVIRHNGDKQACRGTGHCGIQASVKCSGDINIRASYQRKDFNVSSPLLYTPWTASDNVWKDGAWSYGPYNSGDEECKNGGCGIKLTVETDDDSAPTCNISYQYKIEDRTSSEQSNGVWASINEDQDDTDCDEGTGCGMRAKLDCGEGSTGSTPLNTSCRVSYEHRTDQGITSTGYTGYTDNTNSYRTGPWVIDRHGKDDHCNGGSGCGIRAGVQCTNTDYAIRVRYQYQIGNVNAEDRYSSWSDSSTALGLWSDRNHEDGDNECKSSTGGCKVRMEVETNNPDVTCSIGYRHRADTATSPLAYDWEWSTLNESGDGGENCNDAGCGMEVRLYCDGPGGTNTGGTGGSGGGTTCGAGGTCSGTNGSTCDPDDGNPGDGICSNGCCFDLGGLGGGNCDPFDPDCDGRSLQ